MCGSTGACPVFSARRMSPSGHKSWSRLRKEQPMTKFKVGDRVRVRATSSPADDAGKTGKVVLVRSTMTGVLYAYHVKLEGHSSDDPFETGVVFGLHELEPEASD